jgi:3-dehydroquinate synthetase
MQALMGVDKKARDGRVPFVILERVGAATLCDDVPPVHLARSLARYAA